MVRRQLLSSVWCPCQLLDISIVFEAGDVPCPGPFHFFTLPIIYMTHNLVLCGVEHTSFHFGLIDYATAAFDIKINKMKEV